MRGEIDGVIERGAACAGRRARDRALRPNRSPGTANSAAVHFGVVERMSEPADRAREILQELDVGAEADDESLVFGAQRALEKRTANFLLHIEDAQLAPARIKKNAEGQREIGVGLEILNSLMLAVFEQVEVVLVQVWNQRAMLVLNVKEQLDDFDVDLQRLDRLILRLVVRIGTGVGSGIGIGSRAGRRGGRGRRRWWNRRILRGCGERQGRHESKHHQGERSQGKRHEGEHGRSEETRGQAQFTMWFRHQRIYPKTLLVYP